MFLCGIDKAILIKRINNVMCGRNLSNPRANIIFLNQTLIKDR